MLTVNVESEFDPALLRRAIAQLETAVRADAKNTRYRKVLSEAYLAARKFDAAYQQLEIVWLENPEPRAAYLLAYTAYRLERYAEAEQRLSDIGEQAESFGFSRMHELRGRIFYGRGDFAEAVNEFSRALIINPDSRGPRWYLARSLVAYAQYRVNDTRALYLRALQILKDLGPKLNWEDEWHELLGRTYLALHHPIEALQHFERSRQPANDEKSMLVGFTYLLHGENDRAQELLHAAVQNADIRPRCSLYLQELASYPRHLMQGLGVATGPNNIPLFLDVNFLSAVFGDNAEEIGLLIHAGSQPRPELLARTRAEVNPDSSQYGHLLVPPELGEQGSTPKPKVEEATTNAEDAAPPHGDRLFPKTILEIPTTKMSSPHHGAEDASGRGAVNTDGQSHASEDDWDVKLDDKLMVNERPPKSSPTTETMAAEESDGDTDKMPTEEGPEDDEGETS